MVIPIHIQYKYTSYRLAPKATQKSKRLGIFTSVSAIVLYCFIVFAIYGCIMDTCGIHDNSAIMVGLLLLIPFVYGILQLKKYLTRKIEEDAGKEIKQNIELIDMVYKASFYFSGPFTKNDIKDRFSVAPNNDSLQFALTQLVGIGKLKREGKAINVRYFRI